MGPLSRRLVERLSQSDAVRQFAGDTLVEIGRLIGTGRPAEPAEAK